MPVARNSNLTLAFILITILLDMVGLGIILPVLPGLIEELIKPAMAGASTEGLVARASVIGGYMLLVYALMQFLFSPVLGNLSDRFGRRPVLLLSLLGLTADYLIMGFAPAVGWLFLGRFLSGVSGAAVTTATAYIADITPAEKRSHRFGLIGAAFGLGFIIGPVVGGLLGELGHRVPFYAAAGLAFANFLYGMIVLPESLNKRHRRRFEIKRANPFGALVALRRYPSVIWLLGALFIFALAGQTYPSVWNFFTIERFGWSSSQIGISLGVFGVLFAFWQGFMMRPTVKRFGESYTVLIGMAAAAVAFFGTAFINTPVGLYGYLIVGSISGLAPPAINGLLSRQVSDNQQGELQGAVNAANSLSMVIAPWAATQLFSFFTTSPKAPTYFPGVPFLGAGVLTVIAAGVFLYAMMRFDLRHRPSAAQHPHTPTMAPPGQMATPPELEEEQKAE